MADFVEKEKRNNPLSFLPLSFPRERVGGGERERGEGERGSGGVGDKTEKGREENTEGYRIRESQREGGKERGRDLSYLAHDRHRSCLVNKKIGNLALKTTGAYRPA